MMPRCMCPASSCGTSVGASGSNELASTDRAALGFHVALPVVGVSPPCTPNLDPWPAASGNALTRCACVSRLSPAVVSRARSRRLSACTSWCGLLEQHLVLFVFQDLLLVVKGMNAEGS